MRTVFTTLAFASVLAFVPLQSASAKSSGKKHMMTVKTINGESRQLEMRKIGGRMMILVPYTDYDKYFKHDLG